MDLRELPPTKQWSMVMIRDSSSTQNDVVDSIFPPCNHENLTPCSFKHSPPSPTSPLSFSPSDTDLPPSPPSPHAVAVVPGWWGFAIRILRARIGNLGKRKAFWSVGVSVVALVWWVSVRMRRRWRRRERVGQLLEVMKQKDEKIIQLLNQIVQMNKLLLARHNLQTPKLAG